MTNKYEQMIRNAKKVSVLPVGDSDSKKSKGREIWDVETEGLGNFEVTVDIPAGTNNLKNTEKRFDKVRALVFKEVLPQIEAADKAHAG